MWGGSLLAVDLRSAFRGLITWFRRARISPMGKFLREDGDSGVPGVTHCLSVLIVSIPGSTPRAK